jgi:hypothetical protein
VCPAFVSAVSQFVSHAGAAAIVEKEWRLSYVHQNNVARTSVRQHQLDDYRNQLFRLRYGMPPRLIHVVHCVLEYSDTSSNDDNCSRITFVIRNIR